MEIYWWKGFSYFLLRELGVELTPVEPLAFWSFRSCHGTLYWFEKTWPSSCRPLVAAIGTSIPTWVSSCCCNGIILLGFEFEISAVQCGSPDWGRSPATMSIFIGFAAELLGNPESVFWVLWFRSPVFLHRAVWQFWIFSEFGFPPDCSELTDWASRSHSSTGKVGFRHAVFYAWNQDTLDFSNPFYD